MKRIIALLGAATVLCLSMAGCGGSKKDASARASAASDVKSAVSGVVSDVKEGVTDAVSGVVSEADRMFDNGAVSDGDGVIGNEPEHTEETTA